MFAYSGILSVRLLRFLFCDDFVAFAVDSDNVYAALKRCRGISFDVGYGC